jgi:hypothetical protein
MQFFTNDTGKPIIPKCGNCSHWIKINPKEKSNAIGYCKLLKMSFAYTRKENVYGITKDFYFCESHELINAQILAEKGNIKDYDGIEDAVAEISRK